MSDRRATDGCYKHSGLIGGVERLVVGFGAHVRKTVDVGKPAEVRASHIPKVGPAPDPGQTDL